jgi:hypothetical protein
MKEKIQSFTNKWLGFILIYTILQFIWFFFKPLIFIINGKVAWNLWNYIPTINVILSIFLIKTLVEYTDTLHRWITVSKILIWVSFGLAIYGILQYIGLDQIFSRFQWILFTKSGRMVTFFGNSMQTGNYLAVCSPLCLMFKSLKYKIIYGVILIAILFTQSAISIASFLIGLLIYLLLTRKFKWCIVVILFSIAGALVLNSFNPDVWSFGSRLSLWEKIFVSSTDYCFTGRGLGSFANMVYSDTKTSAIVGAAQFELLQIFHDGGIVMLGLSLCYLFGLFIRYLFAENTMLLIGFISAFISYLVMCFGSSPLRIAPLALIGILYISGIEVQLKK